MEEEIDLRPYIEAVISNWMWIVGAAIAFALIALGISSLNQPTYRASALVAITNPRQIVQLDPRIRSADENQPYKAYPELATSDELLTSVLNEVQSTNPGIKSLSNLRGILSAETGSDPSLLRLSVQNGDPQKAAEIANIWASLFVTKANEVFGTLGDEQLGYFETQLADAAQKLEKTEQAFVDFQAHNRSTILESELIALEENQAAQLAKRNQIASVLQDAKGLQEQLEGAESSNDLSPADQLALVLLQLRAFSGGSNDDGVVPWQLQVNVDQIAGAERDEQIAFLAGLQEALAAQIVQIKDELAGLEPQILAVQQKKQEEEVEASRFSRDLKIAEETYTALASKVEEEQITSQNTGSGVRLASQSAVPETPSSRGKMFTVAVAMVVGILLSTLVIVVFTWWRT